MSKIYLIFVILIGMGAYERALAEQEFSDEPVDEIVHPDWFKQSFLDLKDDVADAGKEGKTGIILFFWQHHCPYCKALITNDLGNSAITKYVRKQFDVIALDIFGDRSVTDFTGAELTEREYALERKAGLTPTLDFYDTENNLVFRLRGYYPPDKFNSALHYVVGKHYLTENFRDYLATTTTARIAALNDRTSGLFESPPYVLDRSHWFAEKPLMVLFEKGDCKSCRQLHDHLLSQADIQKQVAKFNAIQLDMWSDTPVITPSGDRKTAVEWAEDLALFYAPTIVFFDESGSEIYRIDSLVKMRRLSGILSYILSGDYTDEPDYSP